MGKLVIAGIVALVAIITLYTALYVVDETEQAVVTRFGNVRAIQTSPDYTSRPPSA